MSEVQTVVGDLLDQPVEVIVNAWNRNFIPWWLLLPQGVSGAIKRRGGYVPFRELAKCGMLEAGEARLTSAGRLPFRGIIHVAALNLLWRSSPEIIKASVTNALVLASTNGLAQLPFLSSEQEQEASVLRFPKECASRPHRTLRMQAASSS